MSEGGEISGSDMNPGQAFKSNTPESSPLSQDMNPGKAFKEDIKEREPYTLWFGDEITFGDAEDANEERSVIIDLKHGKDFLVSHVLKSESGEDMFSFSSFSTHGVEKEFIRNNRIWTVEEIKKAFKVNCQEELSKIEDLDTDSPLEKKLKAGKRQFYINQRDKNIAQIEERAKQQKRDVTSDDILSGIRTRQTDRRISREVKEKREAEKVLQKSDEDNNS